MTEVPGTDRDEAGENVQRETPLVPDDVEDADGAGGTSGPDDRGDEGQTGNGVKPAPGSTELGT
jgi:hypothetical protein